MNYQRRSALKTGGGLSIMGLLTSAGLLAPGAAQAEWNKSAFGAKSASDTLAALNASGAEKSSSVTLVAPEIAENGAVVPMAVSSSLSNVEEVAILIENNPTPLAAIFTIPAGTEVAIQTRCKMGKTSNVIALVKADGKFYTASKEVKVTLGGCGG